MNPDNNNNNNSNNITKNKAPSITPEAKTATTITTKTTSSTTTSKTTAVKSSSKNDIDNNDNTKNQRQQRRQQQQQQHEQKQKQHLASIGQVFSFGTSKQTLILLLLGCICALISGAVGPFMVFYFAKSYSDLSSPDPTTNEFMNNVRELSYTFLVLGTVAFISMSSYSALLQTAAGQMTRDLQMKWYEALLRQDMTYFDIMDVSGTATIIGTNASKYNRGVGNKLGMACQFIVTFLGGLIYAFYASWQTSLVTLLTVPFMALSGWILVKMNTSTSQRANMSYQQAGSIVYTTITSIRTILSLNGARTMIQQFKDGTKYNYQQATRQVHLLGLANGSVIASFLLSSIAIPLYGGYLLYKQVSDTGCDPSGAVPEVTTCNPEGTDIFGAMFAIFFAASVLPQIRTTMESFLEARAACYRTIQVMERKTVVETSSNEQQQSKHPANDSTSSVDSSSSLAPKKDPLRRRRQQQTNQTASGPEIMTLPKYMIDSSSPNGFKPKQVNGTIQFHNVTFAYPTRNETNVLNNLSIEITSGSTLALVGTSGSGKSTVAQLIERFYDPKHGKITLDGTDLKDLNVAWLRGQIGLVSQEPSLFACSIRENIAYGCTELVSMAEVEAAAKAAQCYDFIQEFPKGFETQVGDKGTQLSGGQKQRICIARCLIKNPKILIFDEATSALDSENERMVQTAIDQLLETQGCTSIIVAHRLSTIRNADVIAVLKEGQLAEIGAHDELMENKKEYFGLVEAQPSPKVDMEQEVVGLLTSQSSGVAHVEEEDDIKPIVQFHNVRFSYPSRPGSQILKGFDLSVRRGETLALVGPSGHGKSTIIQLIERFYDPQEGSIDFEGIPLTELNPRWLRAQIGLVSQEPTLFDYTIGENISFSMENISHEQIESAAREANAAFIEDFPDRYKTQVGEEGTQVSGGQKQRICIARVLLRKTSLLLLDEATSALDSESENVVMDKILKLENKTVIIIAHRLSTIRKADRIAVVMNGRVAEVGSYDELRAKENGHFRRLQAFQSMDDAPAEPEIDSKQSVKPTAREEIEKLKESQQHAKEQKEEEEQQLKAISKEKEKRNAIRAREFARGNEYYFLIGIIGAILAGAVFPAWGLIFAYMVELLYTPVLPCGEELGVDCEDYWHGEADDMQQLARSVAYGSAGTIAAALIGYVLLFYGFGTATENLNKRVRDAAFEALIRQEVGWFDVRQVGKLTSQIQEDAALIHSFSGEPIRTLVINVSSVLVGIILGFFYMWPFALLFLGILPFMGFGAEMEMRMYVKGEDEGDDSLLEDENSPGGIVIESLLNIRTVASLGMEKTKLKEYGDALRAQDPLPLWNNFLKGCGFGLGQFFQFWGLALMYWFGAWILHNHPDEFSFRDFIISMFALFFSLYGLTLALEGATDRKRAKLAADRIFNLIDRKSSIDPLSEDGINGDA